MVNPFESLISPLFKDTFNKAIDALLADNALTVPCTLNYGSSNKSLCNNCIFDPISQRSLNQYNETGPCAFAPNSICPVCNGYGLLDKSKTESIYLAVLFDSKYWLNIPKNGIEIAKGSIQTICLSSYLNKLRNATYLEIVESHGVGNKSYERAGDPSLCGFGNTNYCITMWTSK